MKKFFYANFLSIWVLLAAPIVSFGQIYSNTFTGAGACPTQGNTPTTSANATGTPLSRNTVTCTSTANAFNSATLNNTASINNASYIEFSVTANAGAQLNVTSLSFFREASNSAPNKLEVRYSTNGFATSTSWGAAPNTPTTGAATTWDFTDFSVPPGTTLTFRFYPYGTQRADLGAGASNGTVGTFRLDDVTLNGTSPLPVSLVSFTGKSSVNSVVLNWVTAWEEKNQGFEILKSTNAQSFEGIGFVDGQNSTQSQSVYEFTDADVIPEVVYYYRLKQKDMGGDFTLSTIVPVRAKAGEQAGKSAIFPNPNKGSFTLSGQDSERISVQLFTASGAEVPISTSRAENPAMLNVAAKTALAPGLYYLKVNPADGAKIETLKVLVN